MGTTASNQWGQVGNRLGFPNSNHFNYARMNRTQPQFYSKLSSSEQSYLYFQTLNRDQDRPGRAEFNLKKPVTNKLKQRVAVRSNSIHAQDSKPEFLRT